jgi:3-oxoacyl-[acyl-carrier protein] reductase
LISDVHHFSFTVSDIERSVRWYTDVLGLELVHRQRQANAYTRILVGIEDADLAVAQFKIPSLSPRYSTHVLELIEYLSPRGAHNELVTSNVGVAHLALMVTDIHRRYDRLRQHGVVFVNAPVEVAEGANAGGWACYLRDPDGITIEFLQPPPDRLARIRADHPDIQPQEAPRMPGVALVIGAAGGIGQATARMLAAAGHLVAVADRDGAGLDALASELAPDTPRYTLDATDAESVQGLFDSIARLGDLRILVNTAGIVQLGRIEDIDESAWDQMLEVNLKSVYLACRAAIPGMVAAGGGAIVNVSSISGRTKSTFSAPSYVASKAGVIGLTMSLASQHAREGVRVNCVAPGVIDTPMLDAYSSDQKSRLTELIPMARLGTAEEVAACIVFLATDGASYITGQTVNVNGGQFMQ